MIEETRNLIAAWRTQDFRLVTKYAQDPIKFKSQATKFDPIIAAKDTLFPDMHIQEFVYILKTNRSSPDKCPVCSNHLEFRGDGLGYPKYCSRSCRSKDKIPNSESIFVDGKEYRSINDASRVLGIERWQINLDLLDPSKPNVRFSNDHDLKCQTKISDIDPRLLDKQFLIDWKESRKTIKELCEYLGIKTHSTIKQAFVYHGVSTYFEQMSQFTRDKLNDKDWFTTEYKKGGSLFVARQIGCSESTALNKAFSYKIPVKRGKSAIEYHIKDFLEGLGEEVIHGKKYHLDNKREIDLYIPSRKFGIELDGMTFHGENSLRTKPTNYHYDHMLLCRDKNILCMRFTDYETINKLDLVKSMIKSKLGKSDKVIYARNCDIVSVKSNDARRFYDTNHISGFSAAKEHIGLVYDNDLVLCMSFGKPRFEKQYDWEIIRLASLMNTTVVGGAAKCLSKFRKDHLGDSLMTYCDLRFSDGSIYQKLGMNYVRMTGAGYCYFKGKDRFSRHQFQGEGIKKMCKIYDPDLNELTNAGNNGYIRYWDCGNLIFSTVL